MDIDARFLCQQFSDKIILQQKSLKDLNAGEIKHVVHSSP